MEIYYTGRLACPPYCDCIFPTPMTVNSHHGHIPDLVTCRCGEDDPEMRQLDWTWHCDDHGVDSETCTHGADVTFHSLFSQGTAIVRGEKPLEVGSIHYWEIRVITALTGTDVMFGIGTDKMNIGQFKFQFISALGANEDSWGFSYKGRIQYNAIQTRYGQKFSQGCIVGVLLDRMRGELQFFLNRRPLGIAFRNIPLDPSVLIYPMVSSTSARSTIRLINSTTVTESLKYRSFKMLARMPARVNELRQFYGLRPLLSTYWFLSPPTRYSKRSLENEHDIADEAVLSARIRTRAMSRRIKSKLKGNDDSHMNYCP